MAHIESWQVPIFGRTYPSHKVVIVFGSLLASGIAYAVFKPKNYDINKYVEALPKDKQAILKEKKVI